MQQTLDLLDMATKIKPIPEWIKELSLSRNALHTARIRGHLSPAVAGSLAEKLGQDVDRWIVIAALESERESACKDRMVRRIRSVAKS